MARIGDQPFDEFVVVPMSGAATVSDALQWTVLIDERGAPVSALPPSTSMPADAAVPAVIVADANLDLDVALNSDAFAEIADVSGVVVVDGRQIVGVWGGESLARAVMQGPSRASTGPILPGYPHVPLIVRSCRYVERATICATVSTFASRPALMPPCPNHQGLTSHGFGW